MLEFLRISYQPFLLAMTFNVTSYLKKPIHAIAVLMAFCAALALSLCDINAHAQTPSPLISSSNTSPSPSTSNAPLPTQRPSPPKPTPSQGLEQGQGKNQTFEEEIVPQRYAHNPDVDTFIDNMVARYDFDPAALHALFANVSYSATVAQ